MSQRDYALAQLASIRISLLQGTPLQAEAKRYLLDVCRRALIVDERGRPAPESDCLGVGAKTRADDGRQLDMTLQVQTHLDAGMMLIDAVDLVADEFHVSGGTDGAVAKAYRANAADLAAREAVYAARREQATNPESKGAIPTSAVDTMSQTHARNRAKRTRRN